MRTPPACLSVVVATLASSVPAGAAELEIDQLAWLAGCWRGEFGDAPAAR